MSSSISCLIINICSIIAEVWIISQRLNYSKMYIRARRSFSAFKWTEKKDNLKKASELKSYGEKIKQANVLI